MVVNSYLSGVCRVWSCKLEEPKGWLRDKVGRRKAEPLEVDVSRMIEPLEVGVSRRAAVEEAVARRMVGCSRSLKDWTGSLSLEIGKLRIVEDLL